MELREAGIPEEQGRMICKDYRDIPEARYDKITCPEMAEHVGISRLSSSYDSAMTSLTAMGLLSCKLRRPWQYEDLILVKFLNDIHRIDGVPTQVGLSGAPTAAQKAGRGVLTHS